MLLHAHRASVIAKYAQAANKEAQEATMGRYCSHTQYQIKLATHNIKSNYCAGNHLRHLTLEAFFSC
jgi:hypothetical protein